MRHSRASNLANKLAEAQLKDMFGWTQSSEMAAIYVHLSVRDVDKALLRIHGLAGEIMVEVGQNHGLSVRESSRGFFLD